MADFCFTTGSYCDNGRLKTMMRSLSIELCLRGVKAVDLTGQRFSTSSWTTAVSTSCTVMGLTSIDVKQRLRVLKSSQIICYCVDLSTFLFEESLCELFYILRSCCLNGAPVFLPIVDASLIHIITKSSATNQSQEPPDFALLRSLLQSSKANIAIADLLPWFLQSSFFLTTDMSLGEMTSRLVNFAQSVLEERAISFDSAKIWDNYVDELAKHTTKKPNSGVFRALSQLNSQSLDFVRNVSFLDLSFCMMGDAGIRALGEVLMKLACLRDLNLTGNNISDLGCQSLCTTCGNHLSLTSLSVADNQISDGGLSALYFLAEQCSRLIAVDVQKNPMRSQVWQRRLETMLSRNRNVQETTAPGVPDDRTAAFGTRLCRAFRGIRLEEAVNDKQDNIQIHRLSAQVSWLNLEPQSQRQVCEVFCELEGKAAARAAAISNKTQGNAADGLKLEVKFSLQQCSVDSWNTEGLLFLAIRSHVLDAPLFAKINLARLNGNKLPLILSGQRYDVCSDPSQEATPGNTPLTELKSWAQVMEILVTMPTEARRRVKVSYSDITKWNPPATAEVAHHLLLDLIMNSHKNLFSTALRSMANGSSCLDASLRIVFGEETDTTADASTISASVISSSNTKKIEPFFTETNFLCFVTAAGQGKAEGSGGRLARPIASLSDVRATTVGASVTQFYRAAIHRCAGSPTNEILALLKLLSRQMTSGERSEEIDAEVSDLRRAEEVDVAQENQEREAVQVRVTSKWKIA